MLPSLTLLSEILIEIATPPDILIGFWAKTLDVSPISRMNKQSITFFTAIIV
jgi:hypothetical protein